MTRPDLDGVTAFRTHEQRPGRVPSIPRGRRCSPRTGDRAQPAPAASQRRRPIPSAPTSHPPRIRLTRHQRGFKQFTRPVFPSPATARMERAAASAFPRASHPTDQEPDDARRGGGQAIEHGPGQRSRHQPNLQSSVLTQCVRPRVAPITIRHSHSTRPMRCWARHCLTFWPVIDPRRGPKVARAM